jgi:hypothetical protein
VPFHGLAAVGKPARGGGWCSCTDSCSWSWRSLAAWPKRSKQEAGGQGRQRAAAVIATSTEAEEPGKCLFQCDVS